MSDPFTTLPRNASGKLRDDVAYYNVPHAKAQAAMKLGWVPLKPLRGTPHDEWSSCMYWIDCACGRAMRVPL